MTHLKFMIISTYLAQFYIASNTFYHNMTLSQTSEFQHNIDLIPILELPDKLKETNYSNFYMIKTTTKIQYMFNFFKF